MKVVINFVIIVKPSNTFQFLGGKFPGGNFPGGSFPG